MARSSYQKLKPIYIMDYLLKNSDEQHPVTITQLIEYLAAQGKMCIRDSPYPARGSVDRGSLNSTSLSLTQAVRVLFRRFPIAHDNNIGFIISVIAEEVTFANINTVVDVYKRQLMQITPLVRTPVFC